ncbi:Dipeptidyl aminopeptidase/acylaminoacyl peptidase [Gillisia sp. Hel1_33_143]|uniref:S9 family peptidase n=1 Tax=Gillisia sp. Hel1_33_143 TaxID=1336796 RepID=UPI00087A5B6F|nr:S9 family peptidase [Gillisia sp. Hel1_33_143]SDS11108.1 Dipeptidyl aminopeptidase/acylaminoacyl peptidase [Gillisia sp. Hel1_33_143]
MRKILLTFALIGFSIPSINAQDKTVREVTKDDYERATKYLGASVRDLVTHGGVNPNWLKNGNFWYNVNTADGTQYIFVNANNGKKSSYNSVESLLKAHSQSKEEKSTAASYYDVVSPDGKKAAFIRDWNLWIKDLNSDEEFQLTTDGVENFGYATDNAGWRKSDRPVLLWSPDSKKIATYRQDQRHVSDMYLVSTNVGAPKLQQWKYPIAEDSAVIQIKRVIIDVENSTIIPLKVENDPRRGSLCDDISCSGSFDDNEWSADSKQLAFVSTSRDHKIAKLRIANAATGEVRDIFEETVATQYESGQGAINWKFLPKSNEIIWYSERDDWGHLYLYDARSGELKNQITKGDYVVTKVLKVDIDKREIYFEANGREKDSDPYFSHFYKIDFKGENLKLLTPENSNHSISFSPEARFFVDNYSTPSKPNTAVLRDMNGKLISNLEKEDISSLKQIGWKAPTQITVRSKNDKWDLYGLMFTPSDLDSTKTYPVVNYIYPGPQGGGVGSRSFSVSRSDHQALAELGFVVVIIDGACNPGRSKSFHDACYGNMADNTLEDQISGIKQLAKKYSFLDLNSVGIWGHSGGGFATAAAMFKYPEFYKVGISESGNHDSRNYEDDWGERYIGLLTKDEAGNSNYDDQANAKFAKNLKAKLLLAHGGLDDNVPPYNTYLVVDALVKANKDFDLIIFPNARHGFGKDSYYMMRRRWDYFVENLMGAKLPTEFKIEPNKK